MSKHRATAIAYQKAPVIPEPPSVMERYEYLGKQTLRPLSIVIFFLSLGSVYGIYAVFSLAPIWYPFLAMLIVLVPWSVYVVILALFRPRVSWESHRQVLEAGQHMFSKSVDVLVPVCGEDLAVIRNTIKYCKKMRWPGRLRIYVLDDGNSREVKKLAGNLGVEYEVRADRPAHKKSGNLNHGLDVSDGEFVVVFDADFAPCSSFLIETIPYMLYKNVGIVQTTQFFDVRISETRNWIQQLGGSTQDMFFCWAQPARNTADSAMCVGTNVVYRRKALEEIGGFPRVDDGGEDIVTGLDMYSSGYRTIYLPINLAKGVCPDTFKAAINQQYRWALSSMKMFIGKNAYSKSFRRAPLNWKQRVVFWSGAMYYAQSVLVLITAVLPSLVMLWCFPYFVGPGNYIPIAPAMLSMFALPLILRGWRPATLRLIVVYSVSHLLAAIDTVRGTAAGWVPSGAQSKSGGIVRRAGWITRVWVLVTQALQWWALAIDVPHYGLAAYWPAIALCLFQTVVLVPLLLPGYGTVAQFSLIPYLVRAHLWKRKYQKYSQQSSALSQSAS